MSSQALNSSSEYDLSFDFLRVVEAAAIAAARTMGQGERDYSDHVAVETMRTVRFSRQRSLPVDHACGVRSDQIGKPDRKSVV